MPTDHGRNPRALRCRTRFNPAMSSASAFTPATPFVATRLASWRGPAGRPSIFGGIHATLYPEEALESRRSARGRQRRRRHGLAARARRCGARHLAARLRGGTGRCRPIRVRALGSVAAGTLHVGLGANRARLSEALLVLLGLAHRRPGAAPTSDGCRRGRDRRTPPPRLPLHGAGR